MDIEFSVERWIVSHGKVLHLGLDIDTVVVVVFVLSLVDQQLGQEQSVRDIVVGQQLGQGSLSERTKEVKLESSGKEVESGIGRREEGRQSCTFKLGFTRFGSVSIIVVVYQILGV